jgi:Amidase
VVVTPTTPCAGWKVGKPSDVVKGGRGVSDGDMSLRSMEYVYVANWTGCPAISCPMGFVDGNVPVGIMVRMKVVCFRQDTSLTRYRPWVNGQAKNSYWPGDARARVCSRMEASRDQRAKTDGWMCWTAQVVSNWVFQHRYVSAEAGVSMKSTSMNVLAVIYCRHLQFLVG